MKSIINSFKNAMIGICSALRTERNLRFHFVIANLIVIFAYFFGLTKCEWAILVLAIAGVITAELINTGIEKAVDTAVSEYNENARFAKDVSAGAVLLFAVFSLVIGFILFFDAEKIAKTLEYIFTNPIILVSCLGIGILDILFIIFGGKKNDRKEKRF